MKTNRCCTWSRIFPDMRAETVRSYRIQRGEQRLVVRQGDGAAAGGAQQCRFAAAARAQNVHTVPFGDCRTHTAERAAVRVGAADIFERKDRIQNFNRLLLRVIACEGILDLSISIPAS